MILNRLKIFIDINLILKKLWITFFIKREFCYTIKYFHMLICSKVLREREREWERERFANVFIILFYKFYFHTHNKFCYHYVLSCFFKWIFYSSKLTKSRIRLHFLNCQYIFDRFHRLKIDYHYFLFYM